MNNLSIYDIQKLASGYDQHDRLKSDLCEKTLKYEEI